MEEYEVTKIVEAVISLSIKADSLEESEKLAEKAFFNQKLNGNIDCISGDKASIKINIFQYKG